MRDVHAMLGWGKPEHVLQDNCAHVPACHGQYGVLTYCFNNVGEWDQAPAEHVSTL